MGWIIDESSTTHRLPLHRGLDETSGAAWCTLGKSVELCCSQLAEHGLLSHSHGPTAGAVGRTRMAQHEHAPHHRGDEVLRRCSPQAGGVGVSAAQRSSGYSRRSRRALIRTNREDPREVKDPAVGGGRTRGRRPRAKISNPDVILFATSHSTYTDPDRLSPVFHGDGPLAPRRDTVFIGQP